MSLLRGLMHQHLDGHKGLTEQKDVVALQPRQYVWIPLYASHSTDFDVLVNDGDEVFVGTKLAECNAGLQIRIFSSVSGKVRGVEEKLYDGDTKRLHIKIELDHKQTVKSDLAKIDEANATREELAMFMKDMGLVGCGGACFPTYVKYNNVEGIHTVLINAVECEPYITADYKMVAHDLENLIIGARAMVRAADAKEAIIAIKGKHKELISQVEKRVASLDDVRVQAVPDVYPMGWERTLIQEVFKKDYDRLPSEIGVVVNNATTAIKFAEGLLNQMPIVEKVLTFSGDALKNPVNVRVPVGMEVKEIIEELGGYLFEDVKVLRGGPMMGHSAISDEIVVDRATNAITVLKNEEFDAIACLRCGSCSEHCPADLQPVRIAQALKAGDVGRMENLQATSCIECGLCTYVCPSRIEVSFNVRKAKQRVFAEQKK